MNFGELLHEAYHGLGATKTFTATGGSTTTAIGASGEIEEEFTNEDEGLVIVSRTTDGLAPVFEFSRWLRENYDESTFTFTLADTLSDAVGAGDEVTVVDNLDFPIYETKRAVNAGLRMLPGVKLQDISITTSSAYEYTLPIGIKLRNIEKVDIQTDTTDNEWKTIDYWYQDTAAAGIQNKLIFKREPDTGKVLRITYMGVHPKLEDYDDEVHESVDQELAVALAMERIWDWKKNQQGEDEANSTVNNYNAAAQLAVNLMSKFIKDIPQKKRRTWVPNRTWQGSGY